MKARFDRILNVPVSDPDDSRRRKLLNIILIIMVFISLLGIFGGLFFLPYQGFSSYELWTIISISVAMLGFTVVIYFINRKLSGAFASILFLIVLMTILAFSDTPFELTNGRSLFAFCIPIVIASVLLGPNGSILFFLLSSLEVIGIAIAFEQPINFPALAMFLILALVSWLSARSLESSLKALRQTNANLDKLVAERTEDLRQALVNLSVEAGRNQAILDGIADGVIVFDSEGKAIIANPAISRLLNTSNEDIIGSTFTELLGSATIPQQNRDSFASLMQKSGTNLSSFRVEWGKKVLSTSAARVRGYGGELIGTVTVFRDFTKEAEVERMKNAFIAIVSHELRTPLNAISGYAEMLREGIYGAVNEKQVSAFDRIINNTQRLMHIVNDLLDQAQIEAGKLTIRLRPFSLVELLDNVHGVMDKQAEDKGLTLTSEIDPGLPVTITGDPYRLQQIVVNLLNNAIKFTDTGSISMKLFSPDPKHWAIEVADTGRGIPPESLDAVFEAFEQVDSGVTREQRGIGLGLSIVKKLTTLMGGEVIVTSKIGVGSTFLVKLPLIVSMEEKK